jgi:cysteinyl-tRNA synthetase
MSKSTKHYFPTEDVLREFEPDVVRYYLQSTHYRSPIDWSEDRLREAGTAYARLTDALAKSERAAAAGAAGNAAASPLSKEAAALEAKFEEAMDDDVNVARAQGHLFELAKEINRVAAAAGTTPEDLPAVVESGRTLRRLGAIIGLFQGAETSEEEAPENVQSLVRQRDEARVQKDWKRADHLRDEILALGYVLEDSKGGTRARRKR